MPRMRVQETRLLRVGKAAHSLLQRWREGVSHCTASGLEIDELKRIAARDRWRLARAHHRDGRALLESRRRLFRSAISRLYYAMYHAMRAAAYMFHDGDDHESHADLLLHVPDDLPDAKRWANTLKQARLLRNAADYDPYPRDGRVWRKRADSLLLDSEALLRAARDYLKARGCRGLR